MPTFDRDTRMQLLRERASDYVDVAMASAMREYPHFPLFIATGPDSYRSHRSFHPAFYGSYDWHSCVEMHLVAVRLLRLFPEETANTTAREALTTLLTPENIAVEMEFFANPAHKSLERPYGWCWLMMFAAALHGWDDDDGRRWSEAVAPLANQLMMALIAWLPKLTYPQRTGMHPNTAFSLVNALAWARLHPAMGWEATIVESARRLFMADTDYPLHYEPSGADFLSPGLCEAVLMAEILDEHVFPEWFNQFLPSFLNPTWNGLEPAVISDPTDGQIAHLHGLNLSRAWALVRLADALPLASDDRDRVMGLAQQHAEASLPHVSGSDYMVEHWLAVYAMLLLSA